MEKPVPVVDPTTNPTVIPFRGSEKSGMPVLEDATP
jgi:hypothetical protein